MSIHPSTTFARATLEYDEEHERALLEAITQAIFETSRVSDCNAVVIRTGEAAQALLTALACVLAMSPSVTRSPAAIRKTIDDLGKRLRRKVARAEQRPGPAGFRSPKFLEYRRRGQRMSSLTPDREMLAQFAGLMFKHARPDGFVSLRAFPDKGSKKDKPIFIDPIRIGDPGFPEHHRRYAPRQAATWHDPAVFCPPVATFQDHKNAKTDNICEGVYLSVECDQRPLEARHDARSPARHGYRRRRERRRMDKPRDRRDRAEGASALAAEKADSHKGGA